MEKARLVVLTDIFYGFEVDDIQSMIRLLLYSNDIDIEGLISCTSCFVKKMSDENVGIIHKLIDAYGTVKSNLEVHASGWPEPEYLHSIACPGITVFGRRPGNGFAHAKYNDNPGVNRIIAAADRDDERPLFIGLWGGANTLAQALYKVWKTRTPAELDKFLAKLRIYGISDQDYSARWIRDMFGDKLSYIVSPSKGSWFGNWQYWRATWPGISSDCFKHGSEDGTKTRGFTGAETELVSNEWVAKHIQSKGILGELYPTTRYILEGDTPTYLGLIPNGLNDPLHPDYGGWGGRYKFYIPDKKQFGIKEKYPIWTNSNDRVVGNDGKMRCSSQASIWRWRTAVQNDMVARMNWSVTDKFDNANHPPVIKAENLQITAKPGQTVELKAAVADPNGGACALKWYMYREAGDFEGNIEIIPDGESARFTVPNGVRDGTIHVILEATDNGTPALTRYARFIVTVVRQ